MAKKKKELDIDGMMDMLIKQFASMDKKELKGWAGYHHHRFRKNNDLFVPAYQSDGKDIVGFDGCRQHASEEFIIAAEEPHRIKFVGGKRACPPEDPDCCDPERFDAERAAQLCESFNE